jgi:predicted nucleic acid-binding protein
VELSRIKEYVKNRSHCLPVTRDQKPEISRAFDFILDYVRHVHPGVSRIDVQCLAHAEVLGVPIVTDDAEMREAANAYNIKIYSTLELLKLMLECGHVTIERIREIAGFWIYQKDQPINFRKDFKRLFGEDAPR